MKKLLIFGGAGFIASSVIDLALNKGWDVTAFDNNHKQSTDTLIPFITNPNFHFILGDITNKEDIEKAYQINPDYALLAAAIVGYPQCLKNQALAKLVNVAGTINCLKQKPIGCKAIFCSTGSVYKPGQSMCDENSAVDPPSLYGQTKIEGEQLTLACEDTLVYRFGTAMGISKNNIRVNLLANDLTYQSYLNKTITIFEKDFLRSFISVRDISDAIIFGFENWWHVINKGRLFNVSNNDINITKEQLCEMIKDKLNSHVCYAEVGKDTDKRDYRMNCDLWYSTGWRPKVGINETLEELIKVAPLLNTYEKYK